MSPPLDADDAENMDRVWAVDVRAIMLLTRAAVAPMRSNGGGQIVNISSVNGHRALFFCPTYAACKAGVLALTRELAPELAPAGIRVNSVSPGLIAHNDGAAWVERCLAEPYRERFRERWRAHQRRLLPLQQPLARIGRPYDIAMACLYLCSPAAAFITGVDLLVDGGRLQEMPEVEQRCMQRWKTTDDIELRRELTALPEEAWLHKPRWLINALAAAKA
jgi:NAD(P)-dependent dehydrogenase (short-subunit alcohol dehydrogenase family)